MVIKSIAITPAIAKQWLEKNMPTNRRIKTGHVNKIAADILADRWIETGETIKFNMSGFLIDGQHRLSAIIKSGKTISCSVAYDVPMEATKVIDTNVSRSAADVLSINGSSEYASSKAALARRIMTWRGGNIEALNKRKGVGLTNQEILDFVLNTDLMPYITFSWKVYGTCINPKMFTQTEWALMRWVLGQRSAEKAEEFLSLLATLDGLNERHPIKTLFMKLNGAISIPPSMKLQFVAQTWNCWRQGDKEVKLRAKDCADTKIPELV